MNLSSKGLVYLLDDEPGMVKALRRLLVTEGYAVQGFTCPKDFLKAYRSDVAACLVLDVAMPELDGLHLQKVFSTKGILVPIIFLTGHGDIPMSVKAMRAGAVDFLTKPVNAPDLVRAVESALARASENLSSSGLAVRLATLTPREREVMERVVQGKLNKQIAADLGTGEQNIKIHRARMMQKMEVDSLAELVRVAQKLGIDRTAG